ncbi:MAG: hypothetical protein LBQ63_06340 [Deltaproteobacteria bacterium]|nr:hypothetical protein [Deltaproteobacteria bacterium]
MDERDMDSSRRSGGAKRKGPLFYFLLVLFMGLLIFGVFLVGLRLFEEGELRISLPEKLVSLIAPFLPPDEDGRIVGLGAVSVVSAAAGNGVPPLQPSGPALAGGNMVGAYVLEDEERPRSEGIVEPRGQSALDLMSGRVPGAVREKIYFGDDAVVTSHFVQDLALFLAENYWPRGTHISARNGDSSTVSVSALNQRYGLELIGFKLPRSGGGRRDYARDRRLVLNYVFTPSMIRALTHLYADRLADSLISCARRQVRTRGGKKANLTLGEISAMLRFYGDYARSAGLALAAYVEEERAPAYMWELSRLEAESSRLGGEMFEARSDLELTKERGRSEEIQEAAAALAGAERDYSLLMQELRGTREEVVEFMSRGQSGRKIEDENFLYLAAWAARRGPEAADSLRAVAGAAEYLSAVLYEQADDLAGTGP